ncbi:MAG: hypothetical protein ACR2RF_14370 [Geminicoccaceae bacterium]
MANLKERREQEDAWQDFATRLGCELDDVKVQTNAGLIADKRDKQLKAALPVWLRDRILERTTWRDQDKPQLGIANG